MNALRSLTRYLALALGPDVEVRWDGIDGGDFPRPYCRVSPATPLQSVAIGARFVDRRQTFSVVAYPTQGLNAESSLTEAKRVERLLLAAIAQGIDAAACDRGRAHPLRVPMYDYGELGLREAASEDDRLGWMRVIEPPAFEVVPDPSESGAMAVVCDLRVAWTESVAVPQAGPLTEAVLVGERP